MSLILIVGLPAEMAGWVEARLSGVKTLVLDDPTEVGQALQREPAQLVLVEHNLRSQTGVELLEQLQESGLEVPAVFYCLPNLQDFSLSFRLTQQFKVKRLLIHPIDPEDLISRLRKHLHLAPTTQPPAQVQGRLKQLWDKHSAGLLVQAGALAGVTEADLEDEDRRTYLVKCAHQLAGTVATFGFPKASEMARVVEHSLLDGNPPAQSVQAQGAAILQMLHGTDKMLVSPTGERLEERLQILKSLALSWLNGCLSEAQLATGLIEVRKLRVIFGLFQMPALTTAACAAEALLQGDLLEREFAVRLAELVIFMKSELSRGGALLPEAEVLLWTEPAEPIPDLALILRLQGLAVTLMGESDWEEAPVDRSVLLEFKTGLADQFEQALKRLQASSRRVVVYADQVTPELRLRASQLGVASIFERSAEAAELVDHLKNLATQSGGRLLALDDDPALLGILAVTLGEAGYQLTGEREPLLLWQRLEEVNPDLLILDLEMPQISGLELCKMVRSHARYSSLAILILTVVRDAEVVEALFRAGADDYVLKPVVGNDLTRRIQERLQRPARNWNAVQSGRQGDLYLTLGRIVSTLQLAQRFGQTLCVALVQAKAEGDDCALEECLRATLLPGDLLARWNATVRLIGWLGLDGPAAQERLTGIVARQGCQASDLLFLPVEGHLGGAVQKLELSLLHKVPSRFTDEVVLIEDDPRLLESVTATLQSDGLKLRWLNSLGQALSWIDQQSLEETSRVVLLDVQLGEGGGYELLRSMSEKGLLDRHRVILLTGEINPQRVFRALENGAFDYLVKPFEPWVLLSRVRTARRR